MTRAKTTSGHRFEVEWCANIPLNEIGDAEHDRADFRRELFKNSAEAIVRAKKLLKDGKDAYGSVCVTEQIVERNDAISRDLGFGYYEWVNTRTIHIDDPGATIGELDWQS